MKRAMLCGINEYRMDGADLRGCVNDVVEMRSVLVDLFGFDSADIVTLTDRDATKMRIERHLAALVDSAASGDVIYVHFSGHGSNVPDRDGDEADRRDEIFCPTDLDWRDPLRDDDVRAILDRTDAGVNLTFVADCCHSGSITRALVSPDARERPRFIPCPRDLFAAESGRRLHGELRSTRRSRELQPMADDSVHDVELPEVLLAGCRSDQTAADAWLDGQFNGALTHALVSTLRECGGRTSYRELHAEILRRLAAGGFSQTPQLEGVAGRLDLPVLEPLR